MVFLQTYQMEFEESPQKRPAKGKQSDLEDVDYHEADPTAHADAHADATSDEGAPPMELINGIQGEVKELHQLTIEAQAEKERKLRLRREQRERLKLRKQEEQRLAAVVSQTMMDEIATPYANDATGVRIALNAATTTKIQSGMAQPARTPSVPHAYHIPQQINAAINTLLPASRPSPIFPTVSGTAAQPSARNVPQTFEPVCRLCGTRHGLQECPAVSSIDDLKALRERLLRSNEPLEDKVRPSTLQPFWTVLTDIQRIAIQCLDEDIAKREQDQLRAFSHQQARTASTSYPVTNKRPSDGPILNERPTKKPNVGSSSLPALCFLCNQPFHPVVDCRFMNVDVARMKRRLDQLAASSDPAAQPSIQALRRQYEIKLQQAARQPTKYIEISD